MIVAKLLNLKYNVALDVFISIKVNTNLLLLPVRGRNASSERFK
jgi:hypothetical protein